MSKAAQRLVTPVGDLMWVFITGKGKEDLNGNDRFVASVRFPEGDPALKKLQQQIDDFWEANKPKGAKRPKSTGIRPETVKDENDEQQPTGNILVNFWTGIAFPDGKPKVIKTMNAKGVEVSLGSKKIGNGSRGAISGVMDIYDNGPNKGVTLYLNAIQLTKFVEYSDDAGFAVQDDEDGFTGEELNDAGFTPADASTGADAPTDAPKVKL